MSIKSIEAQRELSDAAGIPFSSHDAEHDDIIDTIEVCSDSIQEKVLDLSKSLTDVEEKIDRVAESIDSIRYIALAILIGILFAVAKLS